MTSYSTDPVACLVEIAEVVHKRVTASNTEGGVEMTPHEAFVLGQVMGVAHRHPRVQEVMSRRFDGDK